MIGINGGIKSIFGAYHTGRYGMPRGQNIRSDARGICFYGGGSKEINGHIKNIIDIETCGLLAKVLANKTVHIEAVNKFTTEFSGPAKVLSYEKNNITVKFVNSNNGNLEYDLRSLIDTGRISIFHNDKKVVINEAIANKLIKGIIDAQSINQEILQNSKLIFPPGKIDWNDKNKVLLTLERRNLTPDEIAELFKDENFTAYELAPMTDGTKNVLHLISQNLIFAPGKIEWNDGKKVRNTLKNRDLTYKEAEDLLKDENIVRYIHNRAPKTDGTKNMMLKIALDKQNTEGVSFRKMRELAENGDESAVDEMVEIIVSEVINYKKKERTESINENDERGGIVKFMKDNHLGTFFRTGGGPVKFGDLTIEEGHMNRLYYSMKATMPYLAERLFITKDLENGKKVYVLASKLEREKLIPPFSKGKINWGENVRLAKDINHKRICRTLAEGELTYKEAKIFLEKYHQNFLRAKKSTAVVDMMMLVVLDRAPGFKKARNLGDIDAMERIYREQIVNYKPADEFGKPIKGVKGGQIVYFDDNQLGAYTSKGGMIYARLKRVLPKLAERIFPNVSNKDNTVDYEKAELMIKNLSLRKMPQNGKWSVWHDEVSVKNLLKAAFASVGFIFENDQKISQKIIACNADIVRSKVLNYKGEEGPHWHRSAPALRFLCDLGFYGLLKKPRKYFHDKKYSMEEVLNFICPGLVDDNNPAALKRKELNAKSVAQTKKHAQRRAEKELGRVI